ncbi:hypothetical protein V491_09146, partial [Pseudogymnoascus sp. VKM F-3775]
MSFGFSVGDFIAVAELANKIRERFVGSPGQFQAIATEVRGLSIVLQDVKIDLSQRELTSHQQTNLDVIMQGCGDLLKELEITLDKFQELDSSVKISGKRPKRSSQEISAVKDGIERLNQKQEENGQNEERQKIIDWLSPTNYASQQSDFIDRRQEGTGQWLLDSGEFQHWLNQSNQILICPGMPGAGKTMITSIVIDHLYAKYKTDPSIGIAYLYCNFRRQDEQKPVDLLASLLKRLVQGLHTLPNSMKNFYERHQREKTHPSFKEILDELQSIIAGFSTTFIIIDALDECKVSDGDQTKFISEILRLQTNTRTNLLVTSRFIPHITEKFQEGASLEIRATDEDVWRYLDEHLSHLPPFAHRNSDLQELIKTRIVKAVDGMFLLAQLHLESLIGKRSPKAIKNALEKLPTGSGAYDKAYKEAMERIEGQIEDSRDLAKQALGWITCSKRPLSTLELQHALAVEIGQPSLDEENLPEIEDIVSVCAGLVTVDEESKIIRLVHYTTQEYFERTWTSWFPNAQEDIAKTCVTYLLFTTFNTGFCGTPEEFEERLMLNPLYEYASQNWACYTTVGSTAVEELVLNFFQNDAAMWASSEVTLYFTDRHIIYDKESLSKIRGTHLRVTGTHLAAYFGLEREMAALFKKGCNPDYRDSFGRTPLSWAAGNGQDVVVKQLLATAGVDANAIDYHGQTPIFRASQNGHDVVVKLLLATAGVNTNAIDNYGQTPIYRAVQNGHDVVVKLLLATPGVNADATDTSNQTPLFWAAWKGADVMVKLLLATSGVNAGIKDTFGQTPLFGASNNGHDVVVKLLLATADVDANAIDYYGQTPIFRASQSGHDVVVKLLLATSGVDASAKDTLGWTPLFGASNNGHDVVVKLLLATAGVDANAIDYYGQTPIFRASHNGHDVVVKLLLATAGVNADAKDTFNRTPLYLAAWNGADAVVKLLIAT